MSAPSPVSGSHSTAPAATGATNPSGSADASFDASSTVADVGQLQEAAPELWNMMCQGLAQGICKDMQARQDKIKEMNRKAQEDAGG